MEIEGDYSDVMTYLGNLYSIKRIRTVEIDVYRITYSSSEIISDSSTGMTDSTGQIPEKDQIDRLRFLELQVEGITDVPQKIIIGWNSVAAPDIADRSKLLDFLEVLDKSTFRYF